MVSEAIDFRYLLIDNYKKLKITEEELAVIFVMDFLIGEGNPFITADLLALKMNYDVKKIDSILATLLKKGLIEYVSQGKKTITTLKPLKDKLYREFQFYMAKEQEVASSKEKSEELENIYEQFQKYLGRTLSPAEISKIREWVSFGYSDSMIIDALKETLAKGKKSLKSVDRTLLQMLAKDDLQSEGHTTVSDEWTRNLEETIRIAKTPWVDDDDENN